MQCGTHVSPTLHSLLVNGAVTYSRIALPDQYGGHSYGCSRMYCNSIEIYPGLVRVKSVDVRRSPYILVLDRSKSLAEPYLTAMVFSHRTSFLRMFKKLIRIEPVVTRIYPY